ncbi:MAG: hypothetical protein CMH27_03515 [Micavibrio sp.]|nr:hypothetical protein [Micavibrio sp.]|tara:strand:+ start:1043 stop:2089 length:1047 start_codon:yes stop_codon:yes gene_type:complete
MNSEKLQNIKEVKGALGESRLEALNLLYSNLSGQPPSVERTRFRADFAQHINDLEYLEQTVHLIKSDRGNQYYRLRVYSLPLIDDDSVRELIDLMCEIYTYLQNFYREHLNKTVHVEKIISAVDATEHDIKTALFYMIDAHAVWGGISDGFPYKEASYMHISESALLKEDFYEVLDDYYRWHFINPRKEVSENNISRLFKVDKSEKLRFFTSGDIGGHPAWFDRLGDTEKALVIEIDQALSNDMHALPVIGVRALLENIMIPIVEDRGSLENKLDRFIEAGYITKEQKAVLSPVYHAGSAVMHRSYVPSPQATKVCIEVIKHLLHGIYILKPEVDKLQDEVPARTMNK